MSHVSDLFHLRLIQSETGVLHRRLSLSAPHLRTTDVTTIQIIPPPAAPQFAVYLYSLYLIQSSSSFIILLLWRSVKSDRKPKLRYLILIQHLKLKGDFLHVMAQSLRHGCGLTIKAGFLRRSYA